MVCVDASTRIWALLRAAYPSQFRGLSAPAPHGSPEWVEREAFREEAASGPGDAGVPVRNMPTFDKDFLRILYRNELARSEHGTMYVSFNILCLACL